MARCLSRTSFPCCISNYALKAEVIASGLVQKVKKHRALSYYNVYFAHDDALADFISQEYADLSTDSDAFKEACRVASADFARNTRLKHKIKMYLDSGHCIFLTLTFTDDVLSKTSEKTRREYVTRYLKRCSKYYIANIDYGSRNNREHYHAIVLSDLVNFSDWTYGAVNGKHIHQDSNPLVLAKYVTKLVNHAIKSTTRRSHIIYSRASFEEREKDLKGKDVDRLS